jgi:hypothetical protein
MYNRSYHYGLDLGKKRLSRISRNNITEEADVGENFLATKAAQDRTASAFKYF